MSHFAFRTSTKLQPQLSEEISDLNTRSRSFSQTNESLRCLGQWGLYLEGTRVSRQHNSDMFLFRQEWCQLSSTSYFRSNSNTAFRVPICSLEPHYFRTASTWKGTESFQVCFKYLPCLSMMLPCFLIFSHRNSHQLISHCTRRRILPSDVVAQTMIGEYPVY